MAGVRPEATPTLRPECANTGHSQTAWRTCQLDRGCVKTSVRFHTSLFRSLLRGLRAFRVEKIAKNLALLDRLQNVAEFLHGLDPKRKVVAVNSTSRIGRAKTSEEPGQFSLAAVFVLAKTAFNWLRGISRLTPSEDAAPRHALCVVGPPSPHLEKPWRSTGEWSAGAGR